MSGSYVGFGPNTVPGQGTGWYPIPTGQYMCYNTNGPSPGGAPTIPAGCSSSGSIGVTDLCCSGLGTGNYSHARQYPSPGYDNEIITNNSVTLPVGMISTPLPFGEYYTIYSNCIIRVVTLLDGLRRH